MKSSATGRNKERWIAEVEDDERMVMVYIERERMSSYWLVVYSVAENLINGCCFVIKELCLGFGASAHHIYRRIDRWELGETIDQRRRTLRVRLFELRSILYLIMIILSKLSIESFMLDFRRNFRVYFVTRVNSAHQTALNYGGSYIVYIL